MKKTARILLVPVVCALVGCVLLFAASFVPTSAIHANSLTSAEEILAMGEFPPLIPSSDDFTVYLDNYTDQLILMESYTLQSTDPSSVLLNPYYMYPEGTKYTAFDAFINHEATPNINYVRYWQGFRIFIRPLLAVGSYFDILEISSIVFFFLFAVSLILTVKKRGMAAAAFLALSIAFFKPAVIAFSLQYVCCFLLMFVFSIVILLRDTKPEDAPLIFAVFGALTQFFDFYTTPLITYAIPVLLLLMDSKYQTTRWRTVGKTLVSWFYGYLAMWIMKLALVSVFTDVNGFYDGFVSLSGRLGTTITPGAEEHYNILRALTTAWWMSCPGENELLVFLILVLIVLLSAFVLLKTKGFKALVSCGAFLSVAALPLVWVAFAAQPMNIHAWFQHRIMLPFYTGIFLFAVQAFNDCGVSNFSDLKIINLKDKL